MSERSRLAMLDKYEGPLKACKCCGRFAVRKSPGRCYDCYLYATKIQLRSQAAVVGAIIRGDLLPPKKLKCSDCGAPAFGYDHRDYDFPLDVAPVCRSCNHRRGPAKQLVPGARMKLLPSPSWSGQAS